MIFKQNSRRKGETVVLSSTIRYCTNCEMANHDSCVNVSLSQNQLRILNRRVFFLNFKTCTILIFFRKEKEELQKSREDFKVCDTSMSYRMSTPFSSLTLQGLFRQNS